MCILLYSCLYGDNRKLLFLIALITNIIRIVTILRGFHATISANAHKPTANNIIIESSAVTAVYIIYITHKSRTNNNCDRQIGYDTRR